MDGTRVGRTDNLPAGIYIVESHAKRIKIAVK